MPDLVSALFLMLTVVLFVNHTDCRKLLLCFDEFTRLDDVWLSIVGMGPELGRAEGFQSPPHGILLTKLTALLVIRWRNASIIIRLVPNKPLKLVYTVPIDNDLTTFVLIA